MDDQEQQREFDRMVDADERIEPRDWMPEALPQDPDPPDRPARALRDHRHAAGGQLDHPCAQPAPQGDPDGQGAGRGRSRSVPVRGGRDAGCDREELLELLHDRQAEVLQHLQLPDADLGRHGRDRLVGGRRGDRQPGAAVPLLVRPVCPGDGADLQGGVVPPAAGLRDPAHAVARHAGAACNGPGRGRPLVVAVADDVRPAGHRVDALRAIHGVAHQAATATTTSGSSSST